MFKNLMLMSLVFIFTVSSFADEVIKPIDSMLPFPVSIDFNGNISWGYPIGPMEMGDMNMGDMNMGEMGHDSEMGAMNNESDMGGMNHNSDDMDNESHMSKDWHFMIMPMLSLGGDSYRRVIAKSESKFIERVNEDDGYYAVENQNIMYGGGAGIMAMPPDSIPMLSLRLSLMPYKGGHTFKLKQIKNKNEVSLLDTMLIPASLKDLDDWRTGDRMSYSARGGIMFGAGVGYSIFAAVMGTYMAEGTWTVSVSKADETTVFLTIKKENMKMIGRKFLNALVDVSASEMKSFSGEFQFLIDLSSSDGEKAYRRILNGDLLFAQDLIKKKIPGLEVVQSSNTFMQGSMNSRKFGLPFLYNRQRMSSKMSSDSRIYQGFLNKKIQSYMSMYRDATRTDGRLSHRVDSGVLFMGMTSYELDMKSKKRFGGVFKWFFQKEATNRDYFKWQLNRLVHKLGFDQARQINLNEFEQGFVSAEIDLALTHTDIEKLMKSTKKYQVAGTLQKLNSYFSSPENIKLHCGTKTVRLCMYLLYKNTKNALASLPYQVQKLKSAYLSKDFKKFNQELGSLGRLALTNRFVLGEVFQRAGKMNLSGILKIKGTNISQAQIQL